jgi:tRNA A37 threonylcarbamoyladenosine modification protein TsaB
MKLIISTINIANHLTLITETDVFNINLPFYNLTKDYKINIGDNLLTDISCFLKDKNIELNQIDIFCAFLGPSLFTNVRLGLVVANTLALSLGKQVMGINNISYLIECAKEQMFNFINISFFAIIINIGKSGAILCITDINGNIILQAKYLDKDDIINYFIDNKAFKYLALGDKVDLVENLANCHIIKENMFNNIDYVVKYVKKCYNNRDYAVNLDGFKQLEPIYIKEPDITIKQVKN